MRTVAIIPARGGSKGLPGKNLRPLGGLSLVARAVAAARAAQHVEDVFVSTDDEGIAAAAQAQGARIIWRPADLSGDEASSESALLHALDQIEQDDARAPDAFAFIQCTSPFVNAGDIDGTLAEVLAGDADSAFAAAPFHYFVWRRDEHGRPLGVNHAGLRKRRQDREPEYLEAGSVYAMRTETFRREKNRFCGRQSLHIIDAARLFEIDDAADLQRAQALTPHFDTAAAADVLPAALSAIVFDFDGVFTDNGVLVDEAGGEAVRCDRGDGMGLGFLNARGIPMLVLSKERNPVVAARCTKLGLECLQGQDDKLVALKEWLSRNALASEGLVYVGNDVNDALCLTFAACAVGPQDSHPDVLPLLRLRLAKPGGHGAVRELADIVCAALDAGHVQLLAPQPQEAQISLEGGNLYTSGASDVRPWGRWTVLEGGQDWCVKRIDVLPGQKLSLQYHLYRDEAWTVAEGTAQVTVGDEIRSLGVGETVIIPRGVKHRIANVQADRNLVMIEVQSGFKLDENDIIRLEDIYDRPVQAASSDPE